MPQTGTGKPPKPKKVHGQPSQRAIEAKKGGAVNINPVKPPPASPGKEDVLRGTTSGSGVQLTTNVTTQEERIAKQQRQERRAAKKIARNREEFGFNFDKPAPRPDRERQIYGLPEGQVRQEKDNTSTRRERTRREGGGGTAVGPLQNAFRDRDLVGSQNDVEEFDGSTFSGGGFDETGGGGGSGSALAGRESVGLAKVEQGESVEDVVYGVQKRSRKIRRARGE